MDANIRIIGTKAITKSGTIQGKVSEIYIGDGGKVEKCAIVAPDGSESEITAEQISIFGKQVTVIDPTDEEEKKTNPVTAAVPPAPKGAGKPAPAPEPVKAPATAPAPKAEEKPAPAPEAKPEPAKPAESAADKATEERHRRFLLGKKAARDIKTDSGVLIVKAGGDITEEVLQKAKLANKFIELSMNIQ